MDINEILSSNSSAPLTKDEIYELMYSRYIINASSPDRVRNCVPLIKYNIKEFLFDLDLKCIDFSNPELIKSLNDFDFEYKVKFMIKAKEEGIDTTPFDPTRFYEMLFQHPNPIVLGRIIKNSDPRAVMNPILATNEDATKLSETEIQIAIEYIVKNNVPFHKIPAVIAEREDFLTRYAKESSVEMTEEEIEVLSSDRYDQRSEIRLAKSINPRFETIEEVVCYLEESQESATPEVYAAIKTLTLKYLHEHGIDDVDVHFVGNIDPFSEAVYDPETKTINISSVTMRNDVRTLIYTVLHEATHVLQVKNIENLDYVSDPDIDLYTKDIFLLDLYPEYKQNYKNFTHEVDADFSSKIETYSLLYGSEKLYSELRGKVLHHFEDAQEVLGSITRNDIYKFSLLRKTKTGEEVSLDEIVIQGIEDRIKEKGYDDTMQFIQQKYPLLCYEFTITPNGTTKKTPQQLVESAYEAETERDREVYEYLIRSSVTRRKNPNSDKNSWEYCSLMMNPNLIPEAQKIIARNIMDPSNNKYVSKVETIKR